MEAAEEVAAQELEESEAAEQAPTEQQGGEA